MRGNELLDKMELIDPAYIEAADAAPNKRKSVWAKWGAAAACLCLVCVLAVPAMAAFSPAFYELLYAVTPATAQFFKPVQRSCEDNDIRMEVTAAYIHENTAEIYLSLEDLTGTSFDETVDLFDSYRLHTPFDCTGHCQLASYDPDTHTATFLVTLEQWDRQSIEGEKLTCSRRHGSGESTRTELSLHPILDGFRRLRRGRCWDFSTRRVETSRCLTVRSVKGFARMSWTCWKNRTRARLTFRLKRRERPERRHARPD